MRKFRRKGLVFVLCAVLLLAVQSCVTGCGGKKEEGTPRKQEEEKRDAAEEAGDKAAKETEQEVKQESRIASPSVTGALHVEGTKLCGSGGEAVQLRGISTHGLAWFPDYINGDCFAQLHSEWKANVMRLAMYTAENGGYCTDGDKEYLKGLIRDGVRYATEQDMYVIIDWHILSDNNPNMHLAEAKAFFEEMSAEYAGDEHVLYEICNEPNGGTGWGEIKSYAKEVIGTIRRNDPDAVILVGTPNWSQFVDEAAADPITDYENIMYTLHFYAATHTDDLRGKLSAAVEAGLPVFVSEYGICDASGSDAIDEVQAGLWTELLDKYGISYVAWNLSNKEETSAILKSSCSKTSGFSEEDISDSGRWLYRMLTGEMSAADAGTAGAAGGEQKTQTDHVIMSGNIEVTVRLKNSWEEGGKEVFQYDLTLKNLSDQDCTDWAVDIPFQSEIALSDGWNGNYEVQGKNLHITSKEYNGAITAGAAAADVGFIVSGGSVAFE